MNLAESQLFKLTITWPAAYDTRWAFKTLCMVFNFWYIAGNFFTAAFTLIGYFKVTWQLAMKLFQGKISEWAHCKIYDVRRQQCSVTCKCSLMTTVTASLNFQLQNFQLYNKSLKDSVVPRDLSVSLGFPSETLRFLGDKINCLPRDQSLSVYCRLGCNLFMMLCYSGQCLEVRIS